jgi:hypothetical protein
VAHRDPVKPAAVRILVRDCEFPAKAVHFVELWYDDEWLADQRLELV